MIPQKHWQAHTTATCIDENVSLVIFEDTIRGKPVNSMAAGDEISVTVGRFPSRPVLTARVDEVGDGFAVITMNNGNRWRMTPRGLNEPAAVSADIQTAAPTQAWVIRSKM
jgi:hypothetical protein